MLIGLLGKAGSGKDTAADILAKDCGFVKVSLADPLKRFCKEVFDFSDEQLWGPSEKRNAPDARYARNNRYIYPAAPPGALWLPIGGGRTLISEGDLELVTRYRWCVNKKEAGKKTAYVRLTDDSMKLHQLLMGTAPEGQIIDHINGDGLDNRRENLRFCTHAENHANEGKRGPSSSRFKGVGFDTSRGKWYAKITLAGVTKNLGRFEREEEAAVAYDAEAVEAFGEYARANSSMFLTPRYALQQLGTNWGRNCYPNVWIDYAVRVYERLQSGGVAYDQQRGLFTVSYVSDRADGWRGMRPKTNVVIPDVRFKNEVDGIRKAGGKVVRIVRPSQGLSGSAGLHASETEQDEIPTDALDHVIVNNGSLDDLVRIVKELYGDFLTASVPNEIDLGAELDMKDLLDKRSEDIKSGRLMAYDPDQEDVPPHLRKK